MSLPVKEIILAPGQGNHLTTGNSEITFKVVGADTHGHLGLFENLIQPGGTAPVLHIHRQMEEMFYVLSNIISIQSIILNTLTVFHRPRLCRYIAWLL
jgi:hypothetical protein